MTKKQFFILLTVFILMLVFASISRAESACFVATAYNDYGESPQSIEACAEEIPVGKSVTLTWNKVPGATGYKIYYRPAWNDDYIAGRCLDVGDVGMVRILALDLFKLSTPPVITIQVEE